MANQALLDQNKPSGGYRLPPWLLLTYALMFLTLGWLAADIWTGYHLSPACAILPEPSKTVAEPQPVIETCEDNVIPVLRYTAHVYAEDPQQRSITLNGRQYREGDSLVCGAVVAQIQQDVTILEQHGQVSVLDALEDWPGGELNGQDNEP
ncbi:MULTISPECIES: type II secretion system assembly factor GspB [unclassified Serratia (in: enterobacteria)]|uniref:type II secretion system assembly factor GspB n=1 Tax=unclassified Serratia (in: enterobacteria) TaxID=2647522 RepID=UPI0004692C82|nr:MULTISPECIES: type II secretion system assembly factor GspB [unclassified Serratia (in: enterobacteria)]